VITPALVAAAITAACAWPTMAALRRLGVIDHPSGRRSHDRPTVRGGGVSPALGSLAGLLVSTQMTGHGRAAVLVAAGGFGIVGLLEDLRGVRPVPRLVLQLSVAVAVLPSLLAGISGPDPWRIGAGVATVVWLVGYVNAFNFMDGINGISAAQAATAGAAWYFIGRHAAVGDVQAGALIGLAAAVAFAPWNFPTARLFLGDVGSYFFGALLATLAVLLLRGGVPLEAALAPTVLYLADTGVTLVRRIAAGYWVTPHRDHVYQRLVQLGWSHARTTGLVAAVIAGCSLLGAVSLSGVVPARTAADATIGVVVAAYLSLPALLLRRRRRSAS
jgi:UDP-GlcNAc:undecaprenyl-phosphate GlcNAc-1-phosphate transferase